jgi:hypothetical protein
LSYLSLTPTATKPTFQPVMVHGAAVAGIPNDDRDLGGAMVLVDRLLRRRQQLVVLWALILTNTVRE